jgi:MFS family permease
MQVFMSFFSGILVLTFGLLASSNAAFILYAVFYGFASGAFVGIAPAQIAYISKVEQIGVRMGMMFCIVSFAGLIGNPVAGAIAGFDGRSIFAGVMLMAGAAMFTFLRMYVAEWKLMVRI